MTLEMNFFKIPYIFIATQILYWITLFLSFCICFFLFTPYGDIALPLQYLLNFLPSYWLLFPTLMLVVFKNKLTKIKKFTLLFIIFLSFFYLDFQVNINSNASEFRKEDSYTLITANIGEGIELKKLEALVKFYHPDFFMFQEAGALNQLTIFANYPYIDCEGNLCFLSKYKYRKVNSLNNYIFNGYGDWSAFYEIELADSTVSISNIHLPSVRKAFYNLNNLSDIHSNRVISANIINEWAASKRNVIIAGDFNMSINENLYKQVFSRYQNALSDNGLGFNSTVDYRYKGFTIPGIRIDHILFSQNFNIEKSIALESLGGDHYPVLSTFTINNATHE